ncbi:MAG: arsenosugar biosynthesis radical SAM protein ArsS [Nitrospirae bacterium]|nr:arsenosugar biosynthesis radical SAM protein ArsS [Nitrospirota bacterium]
MDFPVLQRERVEILQVNICYQCNQSCQHCHVNAGPGRREHMDWPTMEEVLRFLEVSGVRTLDITGGAPELNRHFRDLVQEARERGVHVIDRCNLTVLEEPGQEDLDAFFAGQQVEIVASMPCYLEENVDRQRGKGAYRKSILALRRLNALGYGQPDSGLLLNLVYNPSDPFLPSPQNALEADYKRELFQRFGIVFNRLYTLTNMPINRFGNILVSRGEFDQYMALLKGAYGSENLSAVMCRNLISVDWQGFVYDCDFNQMLDLPLSLGGKQRVRLSDLMGVDGVDLRGNPIITADHCYGCTAGQGSSCGGALAQEACA